MTITAERLAAIAAEVNPRLAPCVCLHVGGMPYFRVHARIWHAFVRVRYSPLQFGDDETCVLQCLDHFYVVRWCDLAQFLVDVEGYKDFQAEVRRRWLGEALALTGEGR
jgi:hypothetical protein